MGDFLVSVIMPVYNVEKYIAKSIESILNQTYRNFELIIVDDGSPDNSAEIATGFVHLDQRLKLLQKPNGGLSDARNFGMDHANGKFVFFIDSDDWVDPDFLESAVNEILKNDSKLVVFGYHLDNLDQNENLLISQKSLAPASVFKKSENNLKLDSQMIGLLGYAWNKLYDLQYIKETGFRFPKGVSLVEDILFNAPFYASLDKLVVSEKAFYHYNNRPVPTLIKKFHMDSFNLYVLKTNALEKFLDSWNISGNEKQTILSFSLIDGIRYCFDNMIRFSKNLTLEKQFGYFSEIIRHPETVRLIPFYKAKGASSMIYKSLILSNQPALLMVFLKVKKYFYVS